MQQVMTPSANFYIEDYSRSREESKEDRRLKAAEPRSPILLRFFSGNPEKSDSSFDFYRFFSGGGTSKFPYYWQFAYIELVLVYCFFINVPGTSERLPGFHDP